MVFIISGNSKFNKQISNFRNFTEFRVDAYEIEEESLFGDEYGIFKMLNAFSNESFFQI